MDYVTELNAGIVVDRAGLNKLRTEEMAGALSEIYGKGKPVVIMDNVRGFFSNANLFRALEGNAEGLDMILEQRGIALSEDQLDLVINFNNLKSFIQDQLTALTPPPPPYPFAAVPDGWTVEDNIRVTKSRVSRAKGRGDYYVSLKGAERLWNGAAQYWAGNTTSRYLENASYGGYWRQPEVNNNRVEVGCQTIQRYELEQLALALGWTFPEVQQED